MRGLERGEEIENLSSRPHVRTTAKQVISRCGKNENDIERYTNEKRSCEACIIYVFYCLSCKSVTFLSSLSSWLLKVAKARFKRRILHVPNLMQMRENNRFFSFALDSAHVKYDV